MDIYGVKVSDIKNLNVAALSPHRMNVERKERDRKEDRIFYEDIRLNGVQDPILVTPSNEILQGRERWNAAKKAGHKTILGRVTLTHVDDKTLIQIIYKDNNLRKSYADQDIRRVIRHVYGDSKIIENIGGKSGYQRLDQIIEADLGIPSSTARYHLSLLRKEIKKKPHRFEKNLSREEINYGKNRAKEWRHHLKAIDNAEKKIDTIKEKELKPNRDAARRIERELKDYGGPEYFEKLK